MPLFGPPDIRQLEAKRDAQGLIKALSYKDAAIRTAAADALGPLKDPLAVEPLVGLLKDENAGVRRAAVAALAARGGHRVVEPLVASLEDTNFDVRATAATAVYRRLMTDADAETRRNTASALGRLRIADAVEPLAKATMDSDETVRVASIKALQALRDCEAIIPLITVLAHEQVRQKTAGRSSLPVERAASQALDALCDESGIEALQTTMRHEDTDVREIAVRRLARIASPLVAQSLVAVLIDKEPVVRRAAARGLAELNWTPTANEAGVNYWAALREWRRCAECGPVAIPMLLASIHDVDALEQADIVAALVKLDWQPEEADATAAEYWAARGEWDKCIATGEPAVEALDGVLRNGPTWRARVGAAGALAGMGQSRTVPFARLDLVQRALAILDGNESDEDRRGLLEALLADESEFDPETQSVDWCKCGYPAARITLIRERELMTNLLGSGDGSGHGATYYCPSCDTRR
ncbi:MAG TPA: HEAT repeat domain-containing protein [Candidatus Limnocylindrales bacterium]